MGKIVGVGVGFCRELFSRPQISRALILFGASTYVFFITVKRFKIRGLIFIHLHCIFLNKKKCRWIKNE